MAEKRIDLHMHSTCSDGVHPPAALVALARTKGVAAIALTDHDSLAGYPELEAAGRASGVEVLTGVELSCEHAGRDLHVLGYFVDHTSEVLQGLLSEFRASRERRGIRIVELLAEQGVILDIDKVLARAGGGALGRPHVAAALVEAGYVTDHAQAFIKYIGEGGPAYVEKYKMGPEKAVDAIHAAGGLAFVAHPGYYLDETGSFEALLQRGFDGIEVFHPYHTMNVTQRLLAIARDGGYLMSGGSDFHGFAGRDNLGEPVVDYGLLERMREHLQEMRRR